MYFGYNIIFPEMGCKTEIKLETLIFNPTLYIGRELPYGYCYNSSNEYEGEKYSRASILGEDAEPITISFKDYLDDALTLPKRLKGCIDLNNKDGME